MTALARSWMRFWFEPQPAADLGICRALFCGCLFLFYVDRDYSAWADVSRVFWMPTWLFQALRLPVLEADTLLLLQRVWKAALLASALGLLTRLSTLTAFVLGLYLLGLPHSFGKIHHNDAIVALSLGVLAASRCGDAFSLDRLLRRKKEKAAPSGDYAWPIRAVWMTMALVFLAAGVAKVRKSGLEWIFSDNLVMTLHQSNYETATTAGYVSWGSVVAEYEWLCMAAAAGIMALELVYPVAMFSARARWLIVPAMILAQLGIRITMSIRFDQFLLCNLFWIPWGRLIGNLRR